MICKPKKCPDVNHVSCTEPDFVLVNVTDPSNPCCNKKVCSKFMYLFSGLVWLRIFLFLSFFCYVDCNISMCPPLDTKCAVGYSPVLKVPDGKCCPEIKCGIAIIHTLVHFSHLYARFHLRCRLYLLISFYIVTCFCCLPPQSQRKYVCTITQSMR